MNFWILLFFGKAILESFFRIDPNDPLIGELGVIVSEYDLYLLSIGVLLSLSDINKTKKQSVRYKKLILITPLYFLIPMSLGLIFSLFQVNSGNFREYIEAASLTLLFAAQLYTIIFIFTLPLSVGYAKSSRLAWVMLLLPATVAFSLDKLSLPGYLEGLFHTFPFLLVAYIDKQIAE